MAVAIAMDMAFGPNIALVIVGFGTSGNNVVVFNACACSGVESMNGCDFLHFKTFAPHFSLDLRGFVVRN